MQRYGRHAWAAGLAIGIGVSGCGGAGTTTDTSGGAAVRFTNVADGAELTSPAEVCVEASGLAIEAAGDVKEASGHHHLVIDPTADEKAAYGGGTSTDPMAKDERHLHLGDGTSCFTVELSPGPHELMAVVADGAHVPLNPPVVASVNVTAE